LQINCHWKKLVYMNCDRSMKKGCLFWLTHEPIGGNPGSRKKLNVRRQLILFFWRVPKIVLGPRGKCRTGLLLAWQELQTSLEQHKQCLSGARRNVWLNWKWKYTVGDLTIMTWARLRRTRATFMRPWQQSWIILRSGRSVI